MEEIKETKGILKRVLVYVIGFPLLFVAIYLCLGVGGTVAWLGVDIVEYLTGINNLTYDPLVVAVFHTTTQFVLNFFIVYFFGVFLFEKKRYRLIFSLAVSFICAAFILFLLVSRK